MTGGSLRPLALKTSKMGAGNYLIKECGADPVAFNLHDISPRPCEHHHHHHHPTPLLVSTSMSHHLLLVL